MNVVAGVVVVAFGLSLVGLTAVIVVAPALAERVLRSFASSARAHYTEQALRLTAGGALWLYSPAMAHTTFFRVLGLMLIVTSVGLLLVPWRWHHAFGRWAIPFAIRHVKLYGLGALALGVFVLYGAVAGVMN